MEDKHKQIYLKIRAEQIKKQHDTVNKKLFPNGYPFEDAHQIASEQLEMDLKNGDLRISIEELLYLSDNQAINLIEDRFEKTYS